MSEKKTSLTGKFYRNIFKGSGDYTINLLVSIDFDNIPQSIKRESGKSIVTVTGVGLPEIESVDVIYYGQWVQNSKYGEQFQVSAFEIATPKSKKGIISFLSSNLFPGIGKKTAEKIVTQFGTDTMEIFEKKPAKLLTVKGITPAKLGVIVSAYTSAKNVTALASFLAEYGIGGTLVNKIANKYGKNSIEMIKENPYMLMNVAGVGFKTCDKIARGLGTALDSYMRVSCAIQETIKSLCEKTGGMYVSLDELQSNCLKMLNDASPILVTKEKYVEIFSEAERRKLIAKRFNKLVYLIEYDNAERNTALKLLYMLDNPIENTDVATKVLEDYCNKAEIKPSKKQQEAALNSLKNRVSIITGGPGTGKTTIIKAIISVYKSVFNGEVTCMAPTGKAARRMAEATECDASTIHSRLHLYDEAEGEVQPIESGLVIIDEVSMVDNLLMEKVTEAINPKCQLLLCGDVDQLPSVGVGAVLRELIGSEQIPTSRLTEIFRQKDGGTIVENALRINNGNTDLIYDKDFVFIEAKNEDEAIEKIVSLYRNEVEERGIDNVALLSPLRRSQNGRLKCVSDALNPILQESANPISKITVSGMKFSKFQDREFRVGDRIMEWKNKKTSSNGDIGEIVSIFEDEDYGITARIEWDNGNTVDAHKEDFETITLAYSMSVHKSQGSEYESVIIPMLSSQSCQLFKRNLLYTGVTRAKKKVILVGDKKAITNCIKQSDTYVRPTLLAKRLKYNANKYSQANNK